MIVLMDSGIKGEVMASLYSLPLNEGVKQYIVRSHNGILFTLPVSQCHKIDDASFEPFRNCEMLTPNLNLV